MGRRTVGIICGGSGSSKFTTALDRYAAREDYDFAYVCNVGDNFWFHGLYVCPDIDITTYALARILDEKKGWGIRGDTGGFVEGLANLGYENWFRLGDRDLALCVVRTELIKNGFTLSQATDRLRKSLSIKTEIVPASDHSVETFLNTTAGRIHLQDYWVRLKGDPGVSGVDYLGITKAAPNPEALRLLSSDVLIFPANPVTSIMPTINIKGIRKKLKSARVTAISPFVGRTAFSGPAAKLMYAIHMEPSSYGVARSYSDFLKIFVVDTREESSEVLKIKGLGIECLKTDIGVNTAADKRRVAREIMDVL